MTTIRREFGAVRPATAALAALALALALGLGAARAAPPSSVWDLVLDGGQKRCRLTLQGDADGKGAPVAMPAGCRLAFPALKGVAFWAETGDRGLQLQDGHAEPLLAFSPDGQGYRTANPQGDTLLLKPASPSSRAALDRAMAATPGRVDVAQSGTPKAATGARKPAAAAAPASTVKPSEVAGRYAVLRDKTRDTGCMVTLDDKAGGPGSTLKARLAPACRDQGIVIFDPVGWQVEHGELVLTARKGHTTALTTQEDGTWMNDPKKGKTLSLKKI